VAPRLRAELSAATASVERSGLRDWDLGELPQVVELPGTAGRVRAYPALVDEGDAVGVRPFETPAGQAAAMWRGTRRLLVLTVPAPARAVERRLGNPEKLALVAAPHGSLGAVLADATEAAIDALMRSGGGPAWDAAGFARLREHVAAGVAQVTGDAVEQVVRILAAFRDVQRRLDELALAGPLREARLDVAGQIGGLVYDGFVADTGVDRLGDVERYLRGAAMRLDRLPTQVAVDADRMRVVHELEALHRATPGAPREVRWLLEELRVSFFAQGLGVRGGASAKRIRAVLRDAS
jgi:ATP-dependent helicase HrpA